MQNLQLGKFTAANYFSEKPVAFQILTVPLVAVHPLIARLHGSWLWATVTLAACAKNVLSVSYLLY